MKKNYSLVILLIVAVFSSCKREKTHQNINVFSEYISSYPQREISTVETLQFFLKKTPEITSNLNDVVTLEPNVKGKVSLVGNQLTFTPQEKLKNDKEYKVTLWLSKLYTTVSAELKTFTTVLKTKKLLCSVSLGVPKAYNKNYYYVEGELNSSDVFTSSELKNVLTATYLDKKKKISFEQTDNLSKAIYFKIDSLQRFDDDKELLVKWDGSSIESESKGERLITIIGKKNFQILDINVTNGAKQEIAITFSDPVLKNQNLDGLIQFVNTQKKDYSYSVDKNIVKIYPEASFGEKVDIEVFKGIKNTDGAILKENFIKTVYFQQPKPKVSFIKSGSIIPNSNNLKINFNAVSLKAVDVTIYKIYKNNVLQFLQQNNLNNLGNIRYVGRPQVRYTVNLSDQGLNLSKKNAFAIDLANLIQVEEGAMYRVELSFNKDYSNFSCDGTKSTSKIVYGKKEVDKELYDKEQQSYGYYDYEEEYYDDYNWRDREDPCTNSYYRDVAIRTNVFATNLGVIVKKGNSNSTFVAVTDILTTEPVNSAEVSLYNLQQQLIVTSKTNDEGIALFNNHPNAFFAVVTKGSSTTYVRLNDGNALSMSKFDVSGKKLDEGIQGFIYGERGVWRPGDLMYLTFVLNDKINPLPEKHPIKFELIDPQGKITDRKIYYKTNQNVYIYNPKTSSDALTGNWELKVSVGAVVFTKKLKVETVKPNRLKIKINTNKGLITSKSKIEGNLKVKWLHGAIAKNLKFDINGKFRAAKTAFNNFNQYNFDDVTRKFSTEQFDIAKGNLSEQGSYDFSVNPSLSSKSPGMLKASFITKVYENGGGFSTDVFSQKVSPYQSYAGLNLAEEQDSKNYLFTDETYTFNVASVGELGKGIANSLEVKIYKLEWRWWWNTNDNGLSDYNGATEHLPYKKEKVITDVSGKGKFTLKIDKNDWGRYLIKVRDLKSGHVTSNIVYFDWPSWYGKKRGSQDKSNATMLVFTTDKQQYEVNQKAQVKFPSSAGGRALITIENGSEVLDHFWVSTQDKNTIFQFPVLSSYAPNVFVNISLLQQHSQTKNDLPIRMYGSVPMLVNDPKTILEPKLLMDEELKPEQSTTIRVKEQNGKPMTYTIALVDEGLLDLTRFKTPNAWNSFFAKQSLGVKTWDIFDDVVGAYGGKINQILSIGGDEAEAGSKNKKANRFKPMVKFIGPFTLKGGQTKKHTIEIPKYVGSVRAMLVASDVTNNAYGSAEQTVFVRKPIMILASLPRKITPNEVVTLPVTVFAMKSGIGNVTVSLEPNKAYEILGEQTQEVSFNQPDEKMFFFKLKVNDYKGIGNVKINASSIFEKTSYQVAIDVLNPNPVTSESLDLVLEGGKSGNLAFSTFGSKGTNSATIELSALPPINFTNRLDYLIQYPHGCVEQTTSSAFPQLFYNSLFDLSSEKQKNIDRNIKATINRLSKFQVSNGGLSYWPGNSRADDWGTSYAGHFMIAASKQGYVLPIGFKSKWIAFQKQAARSWRKGSSGYYNNDLTQAYRLYTLSLAGSADLASMNRLRETTNLSAQAKLRLAAAYALIGKQSVAKQILKNVSLLSYKSSYYYNYGSELRNKAMALETYALLNSQSKSIKLAKEIAKALSSNDWMSTQTTSYALVAMSGYALKNSGVSGIKIKYSLNNNSSKSVNTSKALFVKDISLNQINNVFKFENRSKGVLYVRVLNKGILPVGKEKVVQSNLELNVAFKNKSGGYIQTDKITQGTNFIANVSIKNITDTEVKNIALTQYFPSGWEIINTRFTDFGSNYSSNSKSDYTDIRDDRVSNYFSLKPYETKRFNILLNASYLGKYYLPGVQAEAMYDNTYIVRSKGNWTEVVN